MNHKLRFKFLIIILVSSACLPIASLFAQPFARATSQYQMSFPIDHGSHPNFETEWWYVTGQLVAKGDDIFSKPALFGFQITFFRHAVDEDGKRKQKYFAQTAITDVTGKTFYHTRRMADGDLGTAGADMNMLRVWNQDWSLESFGSDLVATASLEPVSDARLRLIFGDIPEPVLNGTRGYSSKSATDDGSSMYYSLPNLKVSGEVFQNGKRTEVSGRAWFDHEFMTNYLGKKQVGWDWFNLMFRDGSAIMAFAMRGSEGTKDYISGTAIGPQGQRMLSEKDISWTATQHTRIAKTGAEYPTAWSIMLPGSTEPLAVQAVVPDQEMGGDSASFPSYWEGAVRGKDTIGYFEMTGYGAQAGSNLP